MSADPCLTYRIRLEPLYALCFECAKQVPWLVQELG